MRVTRKKLAYILFFSLIHIILIGTSFYFLYTSPSVGITTAWDKTLKHWKVESAEPWSVLREGDLIKSIGGVDIGYPHLQNAVFRFGTRKEVLAWFEARKELYKRLRKEESDFVIIRDTKERTINIRLGKAGYSFLSSIHIFYLVHALSLLIVGFAVICKKGEDTERFLLFSLCSCFFVTLITFVALISPKLSMEPHFEFLISVLSIAFCIPFAFTQMLHFILLVPKKSVVLDRVPRLPLIEYAAGLLVLASLHPTLLFLASGVMLVLVLAATVHAFFSCSNSVEKSQVKWLGAGYLGWLPAIVFVFIPKLVTGHEFVKPEIAALTFVLTPICMAFAIHRYHLMDLDGLIEGTFVYAVTLALFVGIDIFLMSLLSSKFGRQHELQPTQRLVLSLAVAISIYAAIRERLRLYLKKLFGREPGKERDVVTVFTDTASGEPPESIAEHLESSIRDTFRLKHLRLLSREKDEEIVSAFDGKSDPVLLWESPLQEMQPPKDMLLALPLGREDKADYVLLLGELPSGKLYGSYEVGILHSLLVQARLLYENAWLYDDNLRHCRTIIEEEKKHLSEKEKILRDLHDGIGGIMTNIGLLSAVAQKSAPAADGQKPLVTISELSREGLAEIRTIMHSLDSSSLTWEGLIADLRSLGTNMIEANGMAFEMESSLCDERQRPGSLLYLNLLRIYKECLTNIIKHSQAHRVLVRFEIGPEKIALCIGDDGVGFREGGSKPGRGLSHMRARAADIGGDLAVSSGVGTTVRLEIR